MQSRALLVSTLLLLASASGSGADPYREWLRSTGGKARLGSMNRIGAPPEFAATRSALEVRLRERLGSPSVTVDRVRSTRWKGVVGEEAFSSWGHTFRVSGDGLEAKVSRFEFKDASTTMRVALHVPHALGSVVQVRGRRLVVVSGGVEQDLPQDPERASALLNSVWDTWEGSGAPGARATLLLGSKRPSARPTRLDGHELRFAGRFELPEDASPQLDEVVRDFVQRVDFETPAGVERENYRRLAFHLSHAARAKAARLASLTAAAAKPSPGLSGTLSGASPAQD